MIPDQTLFASDVDSSRIRIESLGRFVNETNQCNFESMLNDTDFSGMLDITYWTLEAVKILLKFCIHTNRKISLKQGSRYFMPINITKGPMLEAFAEAIVSGEF